MARNRYDEVFKLEIDSWCYGIENYPGEIFPELVHAVVREMKPSLKRAIQFEVAFEVVKIADSIAQAAKYLVPEKELVFSLLAQLPNPKELSTEDELYILAHILDQVEQAYPGAIHRVEKRWCLAHANGE